jgi:hypothetical protein
MQALFYFFAYFYAQLCRFFAKVFEKQKKSAIVAL